MPFVNLGLPCLIRDWLVRVSVVDFFVGPAVGTKSAFKFFQEPKEQAFLLSPRVAANRAVETALGLSSVFFGNHFIRRSFSFGVRGTARTFSD